MGQQGLIYGFVFDVKGGGRRVDLDELDSWTPEQGVLWLHFDYSGEASRNWIEKKSGLGEVPAEALLTEESRPRTTILGDGALVALRGVNLNPGSDPEDMVSIRLWVDKHRIISTRRRPLVSVREIAESLQKNMGPKTTGEFMVELSDWLITRMGDTIDEIEDRLAQLEEEIMESGNPGLRNTLLSVRRETIMLRRYLAPQREALIKLGSEDLSWMSREDNIRIREVIDSLVRYLEDLDSARDRASVTQEELINRASEQMNERMYVLSLVAAVFLPLGFLTGLLGINVGGIPGADFKWSFLIFVVLLVVVVAIELLYFKKKKWL